MLASGPGRENAAGGIVAEQREIPGPGADRRSVLKSVLVLGAAAPLAGAISGARAAPPGRAAARGRPLAQQLSSQQLAGQRVIFSYSGLTVPSALLTQISAGEAAGVIFFGGNIS